jgi:hypothetical protein
MKKTPSQDYLRECFDYDSETGSLRWRARPQEHFKNAQYWRAVNKRCAGSEAGHALIYRIVSLNGVLYKAHRLIWKWMTGEEPPAVLDHIDSDGLNNRWANLRQATSNENSFNRRIAKNNNTGVKGISRAGTKFKASIKRDGHSVHLGYFSTLEEAREARSTAARNLHGDFGRDS